jgi:hypothetical protein
MLRAETPQEQFNLIGAGRRNMVINGAMNVAQRATSSTGNTASGFKTVDRFQMSYGGGTSTGTFDITQQADGPEGFKYSTKVIQKGSATSPNEYALRCFLENQDIRQVFGKFVTFSFYYKSNRTGEHAVRVSHNNITGAVTENIPFTVDAANTWERKTLLMDHFVSATATSQADTVWGIHVDIGIYMQGVGTIPVAVDEYFQITGVQLELGKVATPFKHRSYGEELAACQRFYYQKQQKGRRGGGVFTKNQNRNQGRLYLPQVMRASPSFTATRDYGDGIFASASITANNGFTEAIQPEYVDVEIDVDIDSGGGNGGTWRFDFYFDAEL